MRIDDLANADALPTLSAMLRFAGQRHRLIAHNIANISTPDFRPKDVSIKDFQRELGSAIDKRRQSFGGTRGELNIRQTRELRRDARGDLKLVPREAGRNVLFHDRNNRDLERLMQDLVENASAHRFAADMIRSRFDLLRTAISERV